MANGDGGVIVYGVQEARSGQPMNVTGIENWSESEEQRIRRVILNGTYPPVSGIQFEVVTWNDGRQVLALHVPSSSEAPHLIRPPKNQVDQGWFQAPWRSGSHTANMTERQIEEAYRRREQRRRDQRSSVAERFQDFVRAVRADPDSWINRPGAEDASSSQVPALWLIAVAVPLQPVVNPRRLSQVGARNFLTTVKKKRPNDRISALSALKFFEDSDVRRGLGLYHQTEMPGPKGQSGYRLEVHGDGGLGVGVTRSGRFGPEEFTPEFVGAEEAERLTWDLATMLVTTIKAGTVTGDFLVTLGTSRTAQGIRRQDASGNSYTRLDDNDHVPGMRSVSGIVVTSQGIHELVHSLWELLEDFLAQRGITPSTKADDLASELSQ